MKDWVNEREDACYKSGMRAKRSNGVFEEPGTIHEFLECFGLTITTKATIVDLGRRIRFLKSILLNSMRNAWRMEEGSWVDEVFDVYS